jgi:aerobic-type carbon monoxide dehydrogenase small subunit (CoxS/CutS family)
VPAFTLNSQPVSVEVDAGTPLLWVIRDTIGLCGTKFGCGVGQCGACTVHLDGAPTRSCMTPIEAVEGREVRTIEGLHHPVQDAWRAEQVPQCGYCQSGQLMAAAALLDTHPDPDDATIAGWMTNICRCGTYARIRRAIHRASAQARGGTP